MRRLFVSAGIVGVLVGLAATTSYAQPPGTFSLPTLSPTDCSVPVVNISTTEAGGTLGFDFDIAFDPNVLEIVTVNTLAPATDDCEFAFNDNDPNSVSISIACTSPVFGNNPIAAISFRAVGSGTSALTFTECLLDEAECTRTNGSVNVSGCPTVSFTAGGTGTFAISPGRACMGAMLTSNGSSVASVTTDLTFNNTQFGIASCSVNPATGKTLTRTVLGPGSERITLSSASPTIIPDGQLFVCQFTVASGLANGAYVISNAPTASSPAAVAFPTTGGNGGVNITGCAADCNGSGRVQISEVQRASSIFLGEPVCNPSTFLLSCPSADMISINGSVGINEVQRSSCLFLAGTCSKTCP